jgi:hypothetical protein
VINIGHWMAERGVLGLLRDVRRVQTLIRSDLQTTIRGRFPLSDAQGALESYRADMTAGKVLLVPGPSEAMYDGHERIPSVA